MNIYIYISDYISRPLMESKIDNPSAHEPAGNVSPTASTASEVSCVVDALRTWTQ